jgi:hypothetical protein
VFVVSPETPEYEKYEDHHPKSILLPSTTYPAHGGDRSIRFKSISSQAPSFRNSRLECIPEEEPSSTSPPPAALLRELRTPSPQMHPPNWSHQSISQWSDRVSIKEDSSGSNPSTPSKARNLPDEEQLRTPRSQAKLEVPSPSKLMNLSGSNSMPSLTSLPSWLAESPRSPHEPARPRTPFPRDQSTLDSLHRRSVDSRSLMLCSL